MISIDEYCRQSNFLCVLSYNLSHKKFYEILALSRQDSDTPDEIN